MDTSVLPSPHVVLHFWFNELRPQQWWSASEALDQDIKARFQALHEAARQGELDDWRASAEGRLAEIIVLDQFSRQIYRGRPEAFACDAMALTLAQTAVALHADAELGLGQRTFLYMPYMHSESRQIHAVAVKLFSALGVSNSLDFERRHQAIIDRFGRFPHRNAILGRPSTPEELAFLQTPGSSF
jgi:uncharacterized protein (DUF924 family)